MSIHTLCIYVCLSQLLFDFKIFLRIIGLFWSVSEAFHMRSTLYWLIGIDTSEIAHQIFLNIVGLFGTLLLCCLLYHNKIYIWHNILLEIPSIKTFKKLDICLPWIYSQGQKTYRYTSLMFFWYSKKMLLIAHYRGRWCYIYPKKCLPGCWNMSFAAIWGCLITHGTCLFILFFLTVFF